MQLVTVRTGNGTPQGESMGTGSSSCRLVTSESFWHPGPDWPTRAGADGRRVPLDGADLAPVVPRPSKVFCVGLNYLRHVQESGGRFPPIRRCSPSSPTP